MIVDTIHTRFGNVRPDIAARVTVRYDFHIQQIFLLHDAAVSINKNNANFKIPNLQIVIPFKKGEFDIFINKKGKIVCIYAASRGEIKDRPKYFVISKIGDIKHKYFMQPKIDKGLLLFYIGVISVLVAGFTTHFDFGPSIIEHLAELFGQAQDVKIVSAGDITKKDDMYDRFHYKALDTLAKSIILFLALFEGNTFWDKRKADPYVALVKMAYQNIKERGEGLKPR